VQFRRAGSSHTWSNSYVETTRAAIAAGEQTSPFHTALTRWDHVVEVRWADLLESSTTAVVMPLGPLRGAVRQ
jgi:hypothetical protein